MTKRTACPLCGGTDLFPFYSAVDQPISQNFLYPTKAAALAAARSDLELVMCEACTFSFNAAFDENKLVYSEEYKYTQPPSAHFDTFIEELAKNLIETYGVRNNDIVEIGCGKGSFLRLLARLGNNRGVGFDTSYEGPMEIPEERVQFRRQYLGGKGSPRLNPVPDLVVCRQVIEHVIDPVSFLTGIREAIGSDPKTVLSFETPDFGWIMAHDSIWDFYYEHCLYWTKEAFTQAFAMSGFRVRKVMNVFGDQYLRLDASPDPHASYTLVPDRRAEILEGIVQFKERVLRQRAEMEEWVRALSVRGPWAIWGTAAKGVAFCNLFGRAAGEHLTAVDMNPIRQNKFVAVAGTPIRAPLDLVGIAPHTIVVMNPIYLKEIKKQAGDMGLTKACVISVDDVGR